MILFFSDSLISFESISSLLSIIASILIPFLNKLAKDGYQKALKDDPNFLAGLNVCKGNVTYKAVADTFGHKFLSPTEALN